MLITTKRKTSVAKRRSSKTSLIRPSWRKRLTNNQFASLSIVVVLLIALGTYFLLRSLASTGPAHPFPTHITYSTGVMPSATQASRDLAVEQQYTKWKGTYLKAKCGGYIVVAAEDAPNGGTVSEAQGYGMNIVPLMAGYDTNAQAEFSGLWTFVKAHLDQYGLMQWLINGSTCKYADSGTPDGATDGDLDVGYGLILADKQWGGYRTDALNWLTKVWNHDVATDGHLKVEDDDSSAQDSRPSDWMLDHLRSFAVYDTAHNWSKVITKTESLINEFTAAYSPINALISDFVLGANTTAPHPAPANYQENQPDNIVGYNSLRNPWHQGTDALLFGRTTAATSYNTSVKVSNCLKNASGGNPGNVHPHVNLNCTWRNTDGTGSSDTQAEEAGDSVGPAAMASGNQAWTDAIWNKLATNPYGDAYYGETIKMLVYIIMAGDYWSPALLPGATIMAAPAAIPSGSSSSLSWSTQNITSCTTSGAWSGAVPTTGSQIVTPTVTSTYTLSCTGSEGIVTKSALVTVN
jgi:hypothetical protein